MKKLTSGALFVLIVGSFAAQAATVQITVPDAIWDQRVALCERIRRLEDMRTITPAQCGAIIFRWGLERAAEDSALAIANSSIDAARALAESQRVATMEAFHAAYPHPAPLEIIRCGDGILDASREQCDDGNNVGGDGCSADCVTEPAP